MNLTPSKAPRGIMGIMGHVGVGHVHSHSGFVQDDCAGFAVAAGILKKAFPISTVIKEVHADLGTGTVSISLESGGMGQARARRGITPFEAELARRAVGMDALYSQQASLVAFGRIYGQGCLELPLAFQAAVSLAVINSFEKRYPKSIFTCHEGISGQIGRCAAAVVDIRDIPVSVMAVINATEGGLGPNEDLEGNIPLGAKGKLMEKLHLDRLPTFILETKAYAPAVCQGAKEDFLWIRTNKDVDNPVVWEALVKGAKSLKIPYAASDDAYPRKKGEMKNLTCELGEKIVELGHALSGATTASEKVSIVADLAMCISQDAGGVTFMSNDLNDMVGGGGLLPGTSAVLAMAVCKENIDHFKIPVFTPEDAALYLKTLDSAVPYLAANMDKALHFLKQNRGFDPDEFLHL